MAIDGNLDGNLSFSKATDCMRVNWGSEYNTGMMNSEYLKDSLGSFRKYE